VIDRFGAGRSIGPWLCAGVTALLDQFKLHVPAVGKRNGYLRDRKCFGRAVRTL
jgi:hypothetical protein